MCIAKAEIGEKIVVHWIRKYYVKDQYDFQVFFNPENAQKFIREIFGDHETDYEMAGSFNECIRDIFSHLRANKSHVFMSFSVDNDLRFLFETDHVQPENERFFKRHPISYPEDFPIPIVCAQRLLAERCPNTNKLLTGQYRLEDYLQVLCHRQQTHLAVHDVIDLTCVLQKAWDIDHYEIPKTTYMYTKAQTKTKTKTT